MTNPKSMFSTIALLLTLSGTAAMAGIIPPSRAITWQGNVGDSQPDDNLRDHQRGDLWE